MATLKVQGIENANGLQGYTTSPTGLTVQAYLQSDFPTAPTSSAYSPHHTPAATGTTASDGTCSLTGLTSATAYYVCIIDQGGQPHFFSMVGGYVGDGNTHICRYVPSPHAAPPVIPWPLAFNVSTPAGFITSPLADTAYHNTSGKPVVVMLSFDPHDAVANNYGGVIVSGSDDNVTWITLLEGADTVVVTGLGFGLTFTIIVPAGSYFKWHSVYTTGGGRTLMDLLQCVYSY